MAHISIEVTQQDIDKAKVKDSSRCVVATAIARCIPDATRISVDVQSIRFTSNGERHVYLTPYSVSGYVVAFDAGDDIHPFRFQLRGDQQVKARQTHRTEAGETVARARAKAKSKEKSAKTAQIKLEDLLDKQADKSLPPPSPAAVTEAKARVTRAKQDVVKAVDERDEIVAAYEGHRQTEPPDKSKPKAPPQVFKRNERHYGMRKLRVNQHE